MRLHLVLDCHVAEGGFEELEKISDPRISD
jgi:hypothetical protein